MIDPGRESRYWRRGGKVRLRSPSALPDGLTVLDVARDETEGKGRTWSGALLNRLTRSLKEVCRALAPDGGWMVEGANAGESEVERYGWRLVRDDSNMFAGMGDTFSPPAERPATAISGITLLIPSLTLEGDRAPRR